MPHRIPQSVSIRVPLKGYLSADHISDAVSLDPAVVISKNGAGFANPNAGATVATEVGGAGNGLGWYYVDLDGATDVATLGPLIIRATHATMDPIEIVYQVVNAYTMGAAALPTASLPGAANGVQICGSNAASTYASLTVTTALNTGSIVNAGITTLTGAVTAPAGVTANVTGNITGNVTGSVATCAAATLANGAHGGAAATITLQTPIAATVPDTQKVDLNTFKTKAITCANDITVLANLGFAGAPGANNGAATTDGTKIKQTVDLTASQSIAIGIGGIASTAFAAGAIDAAALATDAATEIATTNLLDLANGVETGLTVRNALRLIGASASGALSGAGTGTETLTSAQSAAKNRIVATIDASGNRTIVTDLT